RFLLEFQCDNASMSNERCNNLRNQSEQELKENFLNLMIYYDSMYEEVYTDEPDMT
ncbi:hypothetical protein Bpfe_004768, partial [Biomphalaria pfeifferi]